MISKFKGLNIWKDVDTGEVHINRITIPLSEILYYEEFDAHGLYPGNDDPKCVVRTSYGSAHSLLISFEEFERLYETWEADEEKQRTQHIWKTRSS